jgi:hypothetical protein
MRTSPEPDAVDGYELTGHETACRAMAGAPYLAGARLLSAAHVYPMPGSWPIGHADRRGASDRVRGQALARDRQRE